MRNRRNRIKLILIKITRICKNIYSKLIVLQQVIIKIINLIIDYLKQKKLACFVLILLITFSGIIYSGIHPYQSNFEGNLLVKSIGFEYVGEQNDRLFVNNITNIHQFQLEGIHSFTLHGKFTNKNNQKIQEILSNYDKLKIELFDEKSQFIVSNVNFNNLRSLELSELYLQPNTTIDSLRYYPSNNLLLILIPRKYTLHQGEKPNLLNINFDEQPVKIILNNYYLPELKNKGKVDESSSIEFDLQPNSGQIQIEMKNTSRLLLELQSSIPGNHEAWFRGDLEVRNVHFNEIDTDGVNFNNDIEKSTIIKGEIRMGEKGLKVESNQFIIPDKPGIQRLRNIELHPENNGKLELSIDDKVLEVSEAIEGIEVRIAGKANRIEAGLDRLFPVSRLQSNLLANLGFSNELIIAIISSCSAIIVSLFTWLVNDFLTWLASTSKSTQNP
ncbi:MAG: hypothetical protein RMY28_025950 [Nostoc sp. ChiSLP01]|nr:hypothetical protein [Nostoc sp. CmiSLP01]MDZ8283501.1 hypothetical protein [Nostoc sp. ChiSLP01]